MMTEQKKYEVTISVRLHGAFTVFAKDETDAEEVVKSMFENDEIKLGDLEFADETLVDCVGESNPDAKAVNDPDAKKDAAEEGGGEPPKHVCPLTQQPCDEDCSWAEKANCEYYQGLVAGRAEKEK